jgi:hypothetical protein
MSKLKIRPLKLAKLPYGKYKWVITILQEDEYPTVRMPNGSKIAQLHKTLENSGTGLWRFLYYLNFRKHRVYTKILLTQSMDVAMLKLCNAELLGKIYKIETNKDL